MVLVIPEDDDVAQITGSHHCGDFGIPAGQVGGNDIQFDIEFVLNHFSEPAGLRAGIVGGR
ncbi:hypothetical protein D3C75_737940 [compost metagenome]